MNDYRELIIENKLEKYTSISNKKILVAGCGFGEECRLFINKQASFVVGIDFDKRIGMNYQNNNVVYYHTKIEEFEDFNNYFDIISSIATLEHIHNLENAINNLILKIKIGGIIFLHAGPLWYSPNGHHCQYFWPKDDPWFHIKYENKEILKNIYNDLLNNYYGPSINYKKTLNEWIDRIYSDEFNRYSFEQYNNIFNSIIVNNNLVILYKHMIPSKDNIKLLKLYNNNILKNYSIENLCTNELYFVLMRK